MLAQLSVLARLSLLGLIRRKWSSAVLVISVACVIGVLISMLSVTAGMLRAYRSGEDPRIAIVLWSESHAEFGSNIPASTIGIILDAPGIARGADGHPQADPEILFWVPPSEAYVIGSPNIRGIGPAGFALRPNLRIVAGRRFQSGRREAMVGIAAARRFHLAVGDSIILSDGPWPIVGAFSDDGSILESQLVADADTLLTSGHMAGFGSILVKLQRPEMFAAFAQWIAANPTLKVDAERQSDYSLRTANQFSAFFTELTYMVGLIMAIGALFGIVKLMYAAVSIRTREIATLRAIGYQPARIALVVLLETTVLSVLGALLGTGTAWLLFNGVHVALLRNVFDLSVSQRLLELGVAWALVLALLGGLPPAIRAARLSVTDALRAV